MTTQTETTETKKKGARPTDEIFPVGQDGKPNYKGRIAAWSHRTGGGKNFTINGQRFVMFPVKPKAQPATNGKGA